MTICAIVVSSALAGCASDIKSPQLICAPMEHYTDEQLKAIELELIDLIRANTAPTVRLFIVHYGQLRARYFAAGCK